MLGRLVTGDIGGQLFGREAEMEMESVSVDRKEEDWKDELVNIVKARQEYDVEERKKMLMIIAISNRNLL